MSKPTDPWEDQEYWRSKLAGGKPPTYDSDPQCGWYKYKKFKGGPWIAVVVWRSGPVDEQGDLIDDERIVATADGVPVDPREKWTWFCQYPVTPEDYQKLMAAPVLTDPQDPGPTSHPEQTLSLADAEPVF